MCEVPGWGVQLEPERVLAEMAELGIEATELGPQGWLPDDAGPLLERHGLQLVGAFLPLVVDDAARELLQHAAAQVAAAGGEFLIAALLQDLAWSAPQPLDADGFARAGEHLDALSDLAGAEGVRLVLHPHTGTLVETAADVELALEHVRVPWCLDTGHLLLGGTDPVAFAQANADRVGHLHLKDVDAELAARYRSGAIDFLAATRAGLFQPLGAGDVDLGAVLAASRATTGGR